MPSTGRKLPFCYISLLILLFRLIAVVANAPYRLNAGVVPHLCLHNRRDVGVREVNDALPYI